jgi:DNA-binding NtrC family response regulator
VLTDVMMPELNGRALAGALAAAVPGTRIALMSGFDAATGAQGGPPETAGLPLLEKPFTAEQLLATVRGALAPGAPAPGAPALAAV